MTFPISAKLLNLSSQFVANSPTLTVKTDPSSDIDFAANGYVIKTTLNTKYNFSAGLSTAVTPTAGNDITNKAYVDALFAGQRWKDKVRVATTANITLSGLQTIDGVALSADERVLVKNQSVASQNGIYLTSNGGWVRTADMPVGSEASSIFVPVAEGSANGNKVWMQTAEGLVNTVSQTWTDVPMGVIPTNGNGLQNSSNTWSVLAANTSLVVNGSGVAVNLATNSGLEVSSGLRINVNLFTEETVLATGDFFPIWDVSAGAMRKITWANVRSTLTQGSTKFPEYTLTGTDITNKTATIPGVANAVGANHIVFYNNQMCDSGDATLNTTTGVLSWTGLSLDGRAESGAKITVWGRL